jgi:hypothetical protein
MMREADKNGDGKIDYNGKSRKFIAWRHLTHYCPLRIHRGTVSKTTSLVPTHHSIR